VLSAKLKHITSGTTCAQVGGRYTGPEGRQDLHLPYEKPGYRHVFHLYVIETKNPPSATPS
jgi:hypothetical protein